MKALPAADPSPLSRAGLAFAVLGGLLLCWPVLVFGGPLVFIDSGSYATQGAAMFRWLGDALAAVLASAPRLPSETAGAAAGAGGSGPGETLDDLAARATEIRSLPYAAFVHVTGATPLGYAAVAWAQAAMTLAMLWPLAAGALAAAPRLFAVAALGAAVLTPLPLLTSYMMPDVFGASVVLFAVLLLGPFERIGTVGRVVLVLLAAFAITTHYGNIPLAVACTAAALGLLALRGRCRLAHFALGAAPIALALAVNLAGSLVATKGEGASITPLRIPFLLARSIADGPARWYLEDACPERGYAVCEAFPEGAPDTMHEILWSKGGLSALDRETLDRIRAEEARIVLSAFLRYPLAQTWSLAGNGVRQFGYINLKDMGTARPAASTQVPGLTILKPESRIASGGALASLYIASYLAGLAGLVLAVVLNPGGAGRPARDAALVVLAGLAANALVFGGLSAPAARYQTRVVWLAPVMAALLWIGPALGALSAKAAPRGGPSGGTARSG